MTMSEGRKLVLSLFPGIGLLDQGFEEEGYTVLRGPDLLWGGDIRSFHPPVGVFDGVIGGPPCQPFSTLVNLFRACGREPTSPDLIPEYVRCVSEAQPSWWLCENVRRAPCPWLAGYTISAPEYDTRWIGEEQSRRHRFTFGSRCGARLDPWLKVSLFEAPAWHARILASGGQQPAILESGNDRRYTRLVDGKVVRRRRAALLGRATRAYFREAVRLQGLPEAWDLPAFTVESKVRVLGNAVPLPLARAVARAVRAALEARVDTPERS